jgi:hypothetical protein
VKLSSISLGVLGALFLGSVSFGQAALPASSPVAVDIYANFVGTWVGTSRVLREGAELSQPLRIEITETANKQGLRFFFTYGGDGQDGFEHATRVATLDPAKGEMTWVEMDNPAAPDALRRTAGLEKFAQTGLGAFQTSYELGVRGHRLETRCTFVLHRDMFGYVYYQSVDGKPFTTYSVTRLTRQNTARAAMTRP